MTAISAGYRCFVVAVAIVILAMAGVAASAYAAADASTREERPAPPVPDAVPRTIKLWPLFEYESDPAAGTSRTRILGPLLEYRSDAERVFVAFRPFFSISQARVGHDDEVRVLYPLLTSHWGAQDQSTTGLGGLFTYRTHTSADGRTLESQRARLLPLYFYDWENPEPYGRFSVAPLYADVENLFGYEHVQMVMFPAYLRLQQPPVDRHYFLFPLISRDGKPGSGYRLWPFPLRDRHGTPHERDAAETPTSSHTFFPLWHDELGDGERTDGTPAVAENTVARMPEIPIHQ